MLFRFTLPKLIFIIFALTLLINGPIIYQRKILFKRKFVMKKL